MLAAASMAGSAAPATAQTAGGVEYDSGSTTSADGSVLRSQRTKMLGDTLRFVGTLAGVGPGEPVELQRRDRRTDRWVTVAQSTVLDDGTFEFAWRTDRAGRLPIRVVAAQRSEAQSAESAPLREVTIFRPAVATWYGPGFYGRRTACGQRMSRKLMGVAHKTLPCGTLVDVYYNRRTITVPVVDRGPFRPNTTWDLTFAAAQALGFEHTDTIGAVSIPGSAANRS